MAHRGVGSCVGVIVRESPFPGPECSISKGMTLGLRSGYTPEHLPLRRVGPTSQRRAMMEPIAWLMCLAGG